ncbi:3-dehydroquinate synthase [Blattabacterium cuenoti]|uniref:3-dehydroquinate synthase n=1 Tax=Blattabacterium cuenoti TaxID=1653831 RepID=UPI00163BF70D|nr:3-dehydroquinate synthase [Blattabacterium cuenoti]
MKMKKHEVYIYFNENEKAYNFLSNYLLKEINFVKDIFILVDKCTSIYCLPILFKNIEFLKKSNIVKIKSGESEKNIHTCIEICNYLGKMKGSRKSILINLGGGVITDIGGFVSSIFKRGIRFINIPTTLLAMVDASIGNKTGVNLNSIKNEIGSFYSPEFLIIDVNFLKTLTNDDIISGMSEMFKHGLIADNNFWMDMKNAYKDIKNIMKNQIKLYDLVNKSILIKKKIVDKDPKEIGVRKILNFGHTIGHALESFFLMKKKKISHGEAITMGMIYESWISYKSNGLSIKEYEEIKSVLSTLYSTKKKISDSEIEKLFKIMEYDKKNYKNKIQFSLLKNIGKCSYNCEVSYPLIKESLLN